jgi:hypothetical protein
MRTHKIAISLLLAGGLLAAVARSQEPPPYPGGEEAQAQGQMQAPDEASATEAATNDPVAEASADYFHQELAPYGQWVSHEGSGEVWVPKVAPGWRPYTTGHWAYTDEGWAWVADEPWGWAAFHYGRWAYDPELGWAWSPGNVWAPAWVAWRQGGGYLGWAPLPPSAGFSVEGGEGLNLAAEAVTPGFFTFVAEQNILAPNAASVILPSVRNEVIVRRAVNATHYGVLDHRVINAGVDVRHIERVTGRPVPRLRVTELATRGGREGRGALYQPPVVTRAARTTRAEFGRRASASQAPAQRRSHAQGPTSEGYPAPRTRANSEPRRIPGSSTPGHRTYPTSPDPRSSYTRPYTAPVQPSQHHPAPMRAQPTQPRTQPVQPRTQEKPREQRPAERSKHKPPI